VAPLPPCTSSTLCTLCPRRANVVNPMAYFWDCSAAGGACFSDASYMPTQASPSTWVVDLSKVGCSHASPCSQRRHRLQEQRRGAPLALQTCCNSTSRVLLQMTPEATYIISVTASKDTRSASTTTSITPRSVPVPTGQVGGGSGSILAPLRFCGQRLPHPCPPACLPGCLPAGVSSLWLRSRHRRRQDLPTAPQSRGCAGSGADP